MKRIAFLCWSLFSSVVLVAQQDSVRFKDTVELLPVEVRALRASATAPFSKTNISRADIAKQNLGQDLPFQLNNTPSVVVNSDAGTGIGYTGIRIRGSDATRINVTLNGVPFNDAESGGTFFVNLPDFLSSVNSIQVQRGVGTSSNGGGAFGATITLSTNEVVKKGYAEFNNSYGSFNSLKNTIRAGSGLLGNHFTVDARLSRVRSNGYIDRATSDLKSFYFSSAYLADKTTIRLNVFSGKEKTYQAWYGVSESDLKKRRTINYAGTEKEGEPYENETDNYQQDNYQLFFTRKFSSKLTFNTGLFYVKGKGYYEQYKRAERYSYYNLPYQLHGTDTLFTSNLVRQLWLDNDFFGDIFSLNYTAANTQITAGGAVAKYLGRHFGEVIWAQNGLDKNASWYRHKAHKTDANMYLKWQQNVSASFQFFTDLQVRRVQYKIRGFRDNPAVDINNKYHFFNPKIGLSYHPGNWLFFASYSVTNKEPNRDDFEAGTTEQPKLENLHDIEIGVEKKALTHNWGATFYYMKYNDQLVLTGKINDVGAYTRTNIDDSYRAGIELQGGASVNTWLKASGNIAFSRNRVKNFTEFIDDYDNGGQKKVFYKESQISFSPDVVGSATLTITPFKMLQLELLSKYVSRQYLDNSKNEARKLNPYFTEDVRAVYFFTLKKLKGITLISQLNNVFNKMYEPNGYTFSYYSGNKLTTENYYFPMAGRNWVVGLNIRL